MVDLCVIAKDEQGNVTQRELSELSGEEATQLSSLASNVMGLLADEDIQQVAADIPNKSAAGLVLFEHTWAIGLKEAIKNAGAVTITGGFVSHDALEESGKRPRGRKAKRLMGTTSSLCCSIVQMC